MKNRWIWLFPAVYFPYHVLIAMRLLRSGRFGVLYENAALPVVVSALAVWAIGMICAITWCVLSRGSVDPAGFMAKTVRNAFFAQVPAYLLYLQACYIFPFTIMTIPIKTFYLPVCAMALVPMIICGIVCLAARKR